MFTWKVALICSSLIGGCMKLNPTEKSPFFEATFPTREKCVLAVRKDVMSAIEPLMPGARIFIFCSESKFLGARYDI